MRSKKPTSGAVMLMLVAPVVLLNHVMALLLTPLDTSCPLWVSYASALQPPGMETVFPVSVPVRLISWAVPPSSVHQRLVPSNARPNGAMFLLYELIRSSVICADAAGAARTART